MFSGCPLESQTIKEKLGPFPNPNPASFVPVLGDVALIVRELALDAPLFLLLWSFLLITVYTNPIVHPLSLPLSIACAKLTQGAYVGATTTAFPSEARPTSRRYRRDAGCIQPEAWLKQVLCSRIVCRHFFSRLPRYVWRG